jgi:hypothetical protein
VVRNNERIIPLMLFAKKDKKYWENIYWDGYKDFIVSEYEKTLEDIREEKFEEF